MADLDLQVILKLKDKATRQLKLFNKELDNTKKSLEQVTKAQLKLNTTSVAGTRGSSGGKAGLSPALAAGVGAGAAAGSGDGGIGIGGVAGLAVMNKLMKASVANLTVLRAQAQKTGSILDKFGRAMVAGLNPSEAFKTGFEAHNNITRKLKEFAKDGTKQADAMSDAFNSLTGETKKSTKALLGKANAMSALQKSSLVVKGILVGLSATIAGIAAFSIGTASKFENLRAKLLGTGVAAEDVEGAFALIKDTASKLPTTIEQTAAAFIKMNALGIVPTQERMIAFGNISSAFGKDILQIAEAVADGATNEFERLKEFGIKARQETNDVVFTFQGAEKRVKKNAISIVEYLEDIGKSKFGDAAALQMDTLTGKTSNFRDSVSKLQDKLGSGALLNAAKGFIDALTTIVEWLDSNVSAIQRFSLAMVTILARSFLYVENKFKQLKIVLSYGFTSLFSEITEELMEFRNNMADVWNDIVEFAGGSNFVDKTPVVNFENQLTDALAKQAKEYEANIKLQEKAFELWNKSIPLTDDAAKMAKEYNAKLHEQKLEQDKLNAAREAAKKAQEAYNKSMKEGLEITKNLRTPMEVYKDTVSDLEKRLKMGSISAETFTRAMAAAKTEVTGGLFADTRTDQENLAKRLEFFDQLLEEGIINFDTYSRAYFNAMEEMEDKTEETSNKMNEFFLEAARSMEQGMSDFFFDAMNGKLSDLAGNFKTTIDRMVSDLLASQLADFLFGNYGQTGKVGGFAATAGTFLSGLVGRASGGPMNAGQAYMVGEKRPEVVVPQVPSFVFPSVDSFQGAMAGGGDTMNITIMANDASSFRDMVERDERWFVDTIREGSRKLNKGGF